MKLTLEFDGDEERDDLQVALDGYKWKHAMWALDQQLRKTTKYGASQLHTTELATETERVVIEALRESLRDILNDWNLNLD
tara:strand:+ start:417 stop:659 length:243 start_codon:yes stop_codon:yes gene_type:complete